MNKLLGKRIRNMRLERDLTQEQVSSVLNMSRQKYARIENGVNPINLEALVKIATVFQIEVSDITRVLDKEPATVYRVGEGNKASISTVFEMLDLFYANKRLYERMHYKDEE